MTPGEIRDYALAKPGAYPDEPWEGDLVAKVVEKIFVFGLGGKQHRREVRGEPRRSRRVARALPG